MIWKLKHSDSEIFLAKAQSRKVTRRGASSRANARDLRKISPVVETTTRFPLRPCVFAGDIPIAAFAALGA
jgi:hypothetical protein